MIREVVASTLKLPNGKLFIVAFNKSEVIALFKYGEDAAEYAAKWKDSAGKNVSVIEVLAE